MDAMLSYCKSFAATTVPLMAGSVVGDGLYKTIFPNPNCDWKGTQATQPPLYLKITLLASQILLVAAVPVVLTASSQYCLSFLTARCVPYHHAINYCMQGALVQYASCMGDQIIKQANGNWSPNPKIRATFTTALSVSCLALCLFPGVSFYTMLFLPRVGYMIYDASPKARYYLDPVVTQIEIVCKDLLREFNGPENIPGAPH